MNPNRSMPGAVIIPVLAYPDVAAAVTWLCEKFGLEERLRIGSHRAQLVLGSGAVVVTQQHCPPASGPTDPISSERSHSLMIRVSDVDRHHARAAKSGVSILQPPTDFPYGERQYTAEDLGGHIWTFSQTTADIDPASWGGVLLIRPPA